MKIIKAGSRARLLRLSVVLASVALLGSATGVGIASASRATVSDGDVQLMAEPHFGCVVGTDANCENAQTSIWNVLSGDTALGLFSTGSGTGLFVNSTSGIGVDAQGQTGVSGMASVAGGTGVFGHATKASEVGVLARNDNSGGQALKVMGSATFGASTSFARSGKLTITAGNSQATKSAIKLTSSSVVLATIQGNVAGVYVQGVTTVAGPPGSFTVHLNKTTPVAVKVGWFVVN